MSSNHIYPYVYKCIHKETGNFYFGFRCANTVPSHDDLGKSYHTSSNYIKPNFNEFDYFVLAEFFEKSDAFAFEQQMIREYWESDKLLNRACMGLEYISKKGIPTGPISHKRRYAIQESRTKTKKIQCSHCGKEIDPGNYKKYHGDNCKQNPDVDTSYWTLVRKAAKTNYNNIAATGKAVLPKAEHGSYVCPICGFVGTNLGNMKRWHFDP